MNKLAKTIAAALLCLGLAAPAMAADQFPSKTINVINPFTPGGWMDLSLRPIIELASQELGVSVITTPTPGASGSIGCTKVAQAKPDGYTMLLSVNSSLISSSELRDVRYNIEDFIPVAAYCYPPNAIIVREGETRFTNVNELVAYAKAHPGELSLGMSGVKNTAGAACGMFEYLNGITLKKVPFNGGTQVSGAVSSGHVDMGISQNLNTSGLKPLMTFGYKVSAFPDLATSKEVGYKYAWNDYTGLFVPKGTPPEVVSKLEAAFLKAIKDPKVVDILRNMKLEPAALSSAEFAEVIRQNREVMAILLKEKVLVSERQAAK